MTRSLAPTAKHLVVVAALLLTAVDAAAQPAAASAPTSQECVPSCRRGFACIAGQCRSACNPECDASSVCVDGDCRPRPILVLSPTKLPGEKSPGAAFALEFFLGFGIGNYYAGSVGWGVVGTLGTLSSIASVAVVYGACGSSSSDCFSGGSLSTIVYALAAVGLALRISAVIAAPVVASRHNRELRRKVGLIASAGSASAWPAPLAPPDRSSQPRLRRAAMVNYPVVTW